MSPSFRHSTIFGHCERCPASESKYWITVPRSAASSTVNRVLPGTQPSATALSQLGVPSRWPTMTLIPLSRMFKAWAGPCTPYPSTATTSFLRTSRALSSGNSPRVTTSSSTPPKLIFAIISSPDLIYVIASEAMTDLLFDEEEILEIMASSPPSHIHPLHNDCHSRRGFAARHHSRRASLRFGRCAPFQQFQSDAGVRSCLRSCPRCR